MNVKNSILSLSTLFLLSACGSNSNGGGSNNNNPIPNPPPQNPPTQSEVLPLSRRRDLVFCYFGDDEKQLSETQDHVNCHFVASWYGDRATIDGRWIIQNEQLKHLQDAKCRGLSSTILMIDYLLFVPDFSTLRPLVDVENGLRSFFTLLKDGDVLSLVKGLYLVDEPNNSGTSAQEISEAVRLAKSIFAEVALNTDVKTCIIYARGDADTPGIEELDWVGFDDYDRGSGIFSDGSLERFKQKLLPHQRLILVPGGCDNWRTSPDSFYLYAQNNEKVVLIMPFIWFDNWAFSGKNGIHSNPLGSRYAEVGSLVKSANPEGIS